MVFGDRLKPGFLETTEEDKINHVTCIRNILLQRFTRFGMKSQGTFSSRQAFEWCTYKPSLSRKHGHVGMPFHSVMSRFINKNMVDYFSRIKSFESFNYSLIQWL